MLFLSNLKARAKAALIWAGDDLHRRALAGVVAVGLGWFLHKEVDSTTVDYALLIVGPVLLSMFGPQKSGEGA